MSARSNAFLLTNGEMRICSNGLTSRSTAALALSIALGPISLKAQCPPGTVTPAASAQTIVGLVTDKSLNPIPDASVTMRTPRRETSTDERGRFAFAGLSRGEYELIIRKIGFELERVVASIGDSGAVVRVCMGAAARPLPAVVTSASRTGLAGVVADGSRRPIPGAEVRIMGKTKTSTDSAGAFFLGVGKGHYAVTVSKPGYGTQLVGVTIPADSGREIAVFLAAPPRNANRYAQELDEMRWRAVKTPANRYAIRTAEDLARSGRDLQQEILAAAGVGKTCGGRIVGQSYDIPVDMIRKSEIAMLEVITVWPGKPGKRTAPPCAMAMIWYK